MPVGELLARTSGRELSEWMAYYMIEPFGEERADLRNGILASIVTNAVRDPNKTPAKPEDFMIRGIEDEKPDLDGQTVFEKAKTAFSIIKERLKGRNGNG